MSLTPFSIIKLSQQSGVICGHNQSVRIWKEGTISVQQTYSNSVFFSLLWALCRAALISSFILSAFRHLWWRASIFLCSGSALRSLDT